jgi:cytochrome c oxidase subunit II
LLFLKKEGGNMVDSGIVLKGQTIAYTFYCIVIILLMIWFSARISSPGKSSSIKPALFYTFVAFLTILGVSLHIITLKTIPWSPMDLHRADIKPDKVFEISIRDHQFTLPADKLVIDCHDKVLFLVSSNDLTYGFGLFRQDNSMITQMQVLPGHRNDLLWQFDAPGVYSIRSTEYSGPKGVFMIVKDAVEVRCSDSDLVKP